MNETKSPKWSKTLWSNLILAVVAAVSLWVPEAKEKINAEVVAMVFAMVNMVLRLFFTDKQLEFK